MYADTYLVGVVDQSLPTYIIKEGTRFISSKSFKNCKKLTSFTIPNSVIRVGENTFDDCYNLEKVTCLATEVPKIIPSNSAVAYMNGAILYVPTESVENYRKSSPWSHFKYIAPIGTPIENVERFYKNW